MKSIWREFRKNWGPNWCVIRHFQGGAYMAYKAWFIAGAPLVTMFFASTRALDGEKEAFDLANQLNSKLFEE